MSNTVRGLLDVLRRRWLLVVATAVIAVVVGVAAEYRQPTTYTAQSLLQADRRVLSTYGELTDIDELLAELNTTEFSHQVARAAGLPDDLSGATLSAYALGATGEIAVTFTSVDRALTEQAGPVLQDAALARFREVNDGPLTRVRTIVENDEAALAEIRSLLPEASGAEQITGRLSMWTIENAMTQHDEQRRAFESAYAAKSEYTVSATNPHAEMKTALGALLLGLVVGAVTALGLDTLGRRRAA